MTDLPKIFIAIDKANINEAKNLAIIASQHQCGVKLGHEFFTSFGPDGVKQIQNEIAKHRDDGIGGDGIGEDGIDKNGAKLFLDLKFYDIPNTVKGGVRAAMRLGVDYLTIHCHGGLEMMKTAQNLVEETDRDFNLIGVTVLTSMNKNDLHDLGFVAKSPQGQVLRLAELAGRAGLKHLVCAPHEIKVIKDEFQDQFHLITPGVRPINSDKGDQKRVMTPSEAMTLGASALVIGRPITASANPISALKNILKEIA